MKCQICQTNEATVHFKQVHNDEVKELHACAECADKNGFSVQSPMSLTDFLFGAGPQPEAEPPADQTRSCAACGMPLRELRKTMRLGCALCYESFAPEVATLLESMQKGERHVGKVPASQRMSAEILSLQKAMDEAVVSENFEEAAILRDRIQGLKSES